MATQIFFTLKSCFSFVAERFLSEFMYRTMFRYGGYLYVSLWNFLLNTFWFIAKYIDRKHNHKSQENGSNFYVNHSQEDDQVVSHSSMDLDSDVAIEKESSNFSLSLPSQETKDSKENIVEKEDTPFLQTGFSANMLKYQFMAGKNVRGFIEEPEPMSFTIQEMFVDSNDGLIMNGHNNDGRVLNIEDEVSSDSQEEIQEFDRSSNASSYWDGFFIESGFCIDDDTEDSTIEKENPEQERAEDPGKAAYSEENLQEKEASNAAQTKIPTDEVIDDDISYVVHLLPGNEFSASDLKPELENSDVGLFTGNHDEVHSGTVAVLSSDAKANEILASATPIITDEGKTLSEKDVISGNFCTIWEANLSEETGEDVEDEYIELEPRLVYASEVNEESSSQKGKNLFEVPYTGGEETTLKDENSQVFGKESLAKESWGSDSDDEDEFDILLEHQQLVKQMKMERKNSKVTGLPTISEEEECETAKILEHLKPLKIDEKIEYKDLMEEIFKFYKSYAEKMRKLDILNYQTLHAISFLQLKDSQLFMPFKKSSISSIKAFSLPSFSLFKQRRIYALKSMTEMHRDLELVYVGQICLSWEILHWQYGKVKELLQLDSQDYHSFNQIAGEYQQFQVLMQRFLEDERFQGPRIQNYVKSRCLCRYLLQIPILKDDCSKDKKEIIGDEKNAISISMLAETIKESMQVFWEFLRADKEEANGVLKSVQGSLVYPRSIADSELLMNVRTCLDKKERKLKEIQRSGNCIVKKFQKHQAGQPSNALFISQVELKLVSRVLSLSRLTTDHLIWCQKKLNNINIVNRKICIEPAFLLFPC